MLRKNASLSLHIPTSGRESTINTGWRPAWQSLMLPFLTQLANFCGFTEARLTPLFLWSCSFSCWNASTSSLPQSSRSTFPLKASWRPNQNSYIILFYSFHTKNSNNNYYYRHHQLLNSFYVQWVMLSIYTLKYYIILWNSH